MHDDIETSEDVRHIWPESHEDDPVLQAGLGGPSSPRRQFSARADDD